jgi:DNA-directed RNA polymerase specialized sigma24 family protein
MGAVNVHETRLRRFLRPVSENCFSAIDSVSETTLAATLV